MHDCINVENVYLRGYKLNESVSNKNVQHVIPSYYRYDALSVIFPRNYHCCSTHTHGHTQSWTHRHTDPWTLVDTDTYGHGYTDRHKGAHRHPEVGSGRTVWRSPPSAEVLPRSLLLTELWRFIVMDIGYFNQLNLHCAYQNSSNQSSKVDCVT
jgi:hypothetical protein